MLIIPNIKRRSRRMMADLLTNQLRRARLINPLPQKQFSQKRIQRLHLLLLPILIFITMLLLQRANKPLQHAQSPFLSIVFVCRRDEERGVFGPVGAVFGDGLGGEEEGWGGEGGEVAFECCDGLC